MFYSLMYSHADRSPNTVAIVHEDGFVTYAEFHGGAQRAAKNLLARGVKPGQTVAIAFDNTIEYLVFYYALLRIGAVVMPLTVTSSAADLTGFCRQCTPDVFIVQPAYEAKFARLAESIGRLDRLYSSAQPTSIGSLLGSAENDHLPLPADPPRGDAVIQYTSGTTGEPKGIVQSQASLYHRMLTWIRTARLGPSDATLCPLALTHAYGSDILALPALSSGGTLHLLRIEGVTPERVMRCIDERQISVFGHLPFFYRDMVLSSATASLASLRIAMCGATPLSHETAELFHRKFGRHINNAYGLTETCLITANLAPASVEEACAIGRLIDGVDANMVDGGTGVSGVAELVVRSPAFAERYFDPRTGPMYVDGWFHSGDLVRCDAGGAFHTVGRITEVIPVDAQHRVMPFELERLLETLPGVQQAAVIGVMSTSRPSEYKEVAAFVIRNGPLSENDIKAYCSARMPPYKIPTHIQFCDSFPRSVTGKISKAKLRLPAN
jgi:acyl-CoA synthetase (AMP-forming)/AMP-acid ligase II